VRASVRAHVNAREGELAAADRYLTAAQDHLARSSPRLIAVGGLSGSGKTTFARRIAPGLGAPPGAVVLRSDEVRKRLLGAAPLERLPDAAYGADWSTKVYDALFATAATCLERGVDVVVDAAFLAPAQREAVRSLAEARGVPFEGVWMEAPAEVLRARIAGRVDDASDADLAVLDDQLRLDLGDIPWRRG
jgi:predicted kinase